MTAVTRSRYLRLLHAAGFLYVAYAIVDVILHGAGGDIHRLILWYWL